MRRLAMALLFLGLIATAQMGSETSSRAAGGASQEAPRSRGTAVDDARTALPLPRTVAVAPAPPDPAAEARQRQAEADAARAARNREVRAARASRAARGDVWAALARCESGGNPNARSANGRYFGAFQFSVATWRSLGYGGTAADHPYETQLTAARRLQARSGWGQWPHCARRLGLR